MAWCRDVNKRRDSTQLSFYGIRQAKLHNRDVAERRWRATLIQGVSENIKKPRVLGK